MNIERLVLGEFQENCYILWKQSDAAIIIDPGAEADRLSRFLNDKGLTPVLYLMTHGHMDHISALAEMRKRYPAPIALHQADAVWAFTEANSWPPFYPIPQDPGPIDIHLAEGQHHTHGGINYNVMETPGHSPGSVSFIFEECHTMISGDTIFKQGVGRTDLPYADPDVFENTLRLLLNLPDNIVVLPGHGPKTTMAMEKEENPFLLEISARTEG
jgi:glyoxylase-like metal-dependent hydrolase (beta-lactamase superfamily II)